MDPILLKLFLVLKDRIKFKSIIYFSPCMRILKYLRERVNIFSLAIKDNCVFHYTYTETSEQKIKPRKSTSTRYKIPQFHL